MGEFDRLILAYVSGSILESFFLFFCFYCAILCLVSSILQVKFTLGNFSENGLKSWGNQEFGEEMQVDRELGLFLIAIKQSQRVLKLQRIASNMICDRDQVTSAAQISRLIASSK